MFWASVIVKIIGTFVDLVSHFHDIVNEYDQTFVTVFITTDQDVDVTKLKYVLKYWLDISKEKLTDALSKSETVNCCVVLHDFGTTIDDGQEIICGTTVALAITLNFSDDVMFIASGLWTCISYDHGNIQLGTIAIISLFDVTFTDCKGVLFGSFKFTDVAQTKLLHHIVTRTEFDVFSLLGANQETTGVLYWKSLKYEDTIWFIVDILC